MRCPQIPLWSRWHEQLQCGTIRAHDEALVIESQHALTRGADELRAAMEAHQVVVPGRAQERAVLDVLSRNFNQRERMALMGGGGPRDIDRRQQLAAHVEYRCRGAGELSVLGEEMIGAVNHDRTFCGQAGAHAVGAHLALAPDDAVTKARAACGR